MNAVGQDRSHGYVYFEAGGPPRYASMYPRARMYVSTHACLHECMCPRMHSYLNKCIEIFFSSWNKSQKKKSFICCDKCTFDIFLCVATHTHTHTHTHIYMYIYINMYCVRLRIHTEIFFLSKKQRTSSLL
jgi:hypothetical protein